jgi:hypothetical protein
MQTGEPRRDQDHDRSIRHALREVADGFDGVARETILFDNIEKHVYECAWILDAIGQGLNSPGGARAEWVFVIWYGRRCGCARTGLWSVRSGAARWPSC